MKKLLCVISQTPYSSSHDIELLEAAMVGAVFEFSVSVLFRDEGVWALLPDQDGTPIGRRTLGKLLKALPTYEIEDLYVCSESLGRFSLQAEALLGNATTLKLEDQAELIASQDAVIGAQA